MPVEQKGYKTNRVCFKTICGWRTIVAKKLHLFLYPRCGMPKNKTRCDWVGNDALYLAYHDTEWGVPVHDDRLLFEMLNLEGAQAGLSWITIVRKRKNYQKAFANFDPKKIVKFSDTKLEQILQNPGIVRNRLKVWAVRTNASAYLETVSEFGTFSNYIWSFTDGKSITNNYLSIREIPAKTELSDQMSKDLKKRGFKFIGSTIVYAYMQAVGIVNDHTKSCFRYRECKQLNKS